MSLKIKNVEIIMHTGEHEVIVFSDINACIGVNSSNIVKALAEIVCGTWFESKNVSVVDLAIESEKKQYRITSAKDIDEKNVFAVSRSNTEEICYKYFNISLINHKFGINSSNIFSNEKKTFFDKNLSDAQILERNWSEFTELLIRDTKLGDTRPIFIYGLKSISNVMLNTLLSLNRQIIIGADSITTLPRNCFVNVIRI